MHTPRHATSGPLLLLCVQLAQANPEGQSMGLMLPPWRHIMTLLLLVVVVFRGAEESDEAAEGRDEKEALLWPTGGGGEEPEGTQTPLHALSDEEKVGPPPALEQLVQT